jgi:hypothetical protein
MNWLDDIIKIVDYENNRRGNLIKFNSNKEKVNYIINNLKVR